MPKTCWVLFKWEKIKTLTVGPPLSVLPHLPHCRHATAHAADAHLLAPGRSAPCWSSGPLALVTCFPHLPSLIFPHLPVSSLPLWRPPAGNRCRRCCRTRRRRSSHPRADRILQGAPPRAPLPPRRRWRAGEPPSRRIFHRPFPLRSPASSPNRPPSYPPRVLGQLCALLVSRAPFLPLPAPPPIPSPSPAPSARRRFPAGVTMHSCAGRAPSLGRPKGRRPLALARPSARSGPVLRPAASDTGPACGPARTVKTGKIK